MMAGKLEAIFGLFALCIFTVFDVSRAETIQGAISLNSGAFDKVSFVVIAQMLWARTLSFCWEPVIVTINGVGITKWKFCHLACVTLTTHVCWTTFNNETAIWPHVYQKGAPNLKPSRVRHLHISVKNIQIMNRKLKIFTENNF